MTSKRDIGFWPCWAVLLLALPAASRSECRTALVVGNEAYAQERMRTPVNDATDVAEALKSLGFEVALLRNSPRATLYSALTTFGEQRRNCGLGFFFFAGRGVTVQGQQYLLPVDAQVNGPDDIQRQGLPVQRVLDTGRGVSRSTSTILVLATSRDNPFPQGAQHRQLAVMDAPAETVIAYATAPGSVALEGTGRNSIYTRQLLQQLANPSLGVEALFKRVRVGVLRESGAKQVPWESSSMNREIYLAKEPQ